MAAVKAIQVNTGRVNVPVRDPYGNDSTLSFNPSDANFRQGFLDMAGDVQEKYQGYVAAETELDAKYPKEELSEDRLREEMKMEHDFCDYMEERIDSIFGAGTCKKVFGWDRVPFAYYSFIEAVTPYFEESQKAATQKYIDDKANRQQRRAANKK